MRNLFETRREHKTLKLAKKLQEEADKEWASEQQRRKAQELNDEAIAKELQAQLEEEDRTPSLAGATASVNTSPRTARQNSPPPLPAKPTAYNSASSFDSISTPLYSLSDPPQPDKHPRLPPRTPDYMATKPSQTTYKPGLQFTVSSPAPQPSTVFNVNTPKLPARKSYDNEPPIHNEATQNNCNNVRSQSNANSASVRNEKQNTNPSPAFQSSPVTTQPSNNNAVRMEMPQPFDVTPVSDHTPATTATAAYGASSSLPKMNHNKTLFTPPPFTSHQSDPIILLPAQQTVASQPFIPAVPQSSQHVSPFQSEFSSHAQEGNTYAPQPLQQHPVYPSFQPSMHNNASAASLPRDSADSLHNGHTQQHHPCLYQQQQYHSTPAIHQEIQQQHSNPHPSVISQPLMSVNHTIQKQQEYTPIYKKHTQKQLFSSSTISLKPDEGSVKDDAEEDESKHRKRVKNRPPTPVESATIETNLNISDDEEDSSSEVDYSDMIYKKGSSDSLKNRKEDSGWKMAKKAAEQTAVGLGRELQRQQPVDEEGDSGTDGEEDEEWQDDAIDPFADTADIDTTAEPITTAEIPQPASPVRANKIVTTLSPTLEIIDPTMPKDDQNTQCVSIPVEKAKESRKNDESTIVYSEGPRQYAEKESKDVEERPLNRTSATPSYINHNHSQSITSSMFGTPIAATMATLPATTERLGYFRREYSSPSAVLAQTASVTNPYQQQHQLHDQPASLSKMNTSPADLTASVYPQNDLKAGVRNQATATETELRFRPGVVPATDFGYLKEGEKMNKSLPTLPNATASEDRHITVASINPGQRVWIRIQPTDTGKALAERIQTVASYRTRRVTKITSKSGRDIPLNNKPLFDDWNELLNFTDGETWKVEWVPIENPYVDIFTEGKEFMKQLKATLKSGSSSSSS